jgi:hypothetical protein
MSEIQYTIALMRGRLDSGQGTLQSAMCRLSLPMAYQLLRAWQGATQDWHAEHAEVERLGTPAAKADTILHRMKRTISEHMDEDPVFYRRFAELVEETIHAYRQGRLDQLEYLHLARGRLEQMRSGRASDLPAQLAPYRHAPAYFGVLREPLAGYGLDEERIARAAIRQEEIIEANKVTDWETNLDIQNQIRSQLDDYFFDLERAAGVVGPLGGLSQRQRLQQTDVQVGRQQRMGQHRIIRHLCGEANAAAAHDAALVVQPDPRTDIDILWLLHLVLAEPALTFAVLNTEFL